MIYLCSKCYCDDSDNNLICLLCNYCFLFLFFFLLERQEIMVDVKNNDDFIGTQYLPFSR